MKHWQTMISFGAKAAVFAALMTLASSASAEDWGSLKGKFVYGGKAAAPKPINVTKDQAFCGKHMLVEEELVVGPDGGLKNVVVYLYTTRRDKQPEVHPDYKDPAKAKMDNANCRFEPHIISVMTDQVVELGNMDPVGHNMNITTLAKGNTSVNVLIPSGKSIEQKFAAEESLPVPVVCNIHPWMKGYVVVKGHPYVGITDEQGNFEIKNIPAGKWKFRVWQEKAGFVQSVTADGKKTDWKRGEVQIEIKNGDAVDLGTVEVDPANFKN